MASTKEYTKYVCGFKLVKFEKYNLKDGLCRMENRGAGWYESQSGRSQKYLLTATLQPDRHWNLFWIDPTGKMKVKQIQ